MEISRRLFFAMLPGGAALAAAVTAPVKRPATISERPKAPQLWPPSYRPCSTADAQAIVIHALIMIGVLAVHECPSRVEMDHGLAVLADLLLAGKAQSITDRRGLTLNLAVDLALDYLPAGANYQLVYEAAVSRCAQQVYYIPAA